MGQIISCFKNCSDIGEVDFVIRKQNCPECVHCRLNSQESLSTQIPKSPVRDGIPPLIRIEQSPKKIKLFPVN
jgi:hypothetical protein